MRKNIFFFFLLLNINAFPHVWTCMRRSVLVVWGNELLKNTLISSQETTPTALRVSLGAELYKQRWFWFYSDDASRGVTDGSAEINGAFPHPNRQAGNFRPWENKLACFTHSSQSRWWGGRERDRQKDRQADRGSGHGKRARMAEIKRWLCSGAKKNK